VQRKITHKKNITRLLKGEESKLFGKGNKGKKDVLET
jgi:hypothetical protein